MMLIRSAVDSLLWLSRVIMRLVEVDRRAAIGLIAAMAVNQVVTVLVFLLPLKVVLLFASDGVPKYFKFFITEETRSAWLIALSASVFILYLISNKLDTIANRTAIQGATSLIDEAEQVPITSDPKDLARKTFYRVGEAAGGFTFSIGALGVGLLIFPLFFAAIPLLVVVQAATIAVSLEHERPSIVARLNNFARKNPQALVKYCSDINFLAVFGLLMVLFVVLDGLNPLLAIAAIMLSRRLLGSIKNIIRDTMRLSRDRHLVDPLLFAGARLGRDQRTSDRERIVENALPSARLERLRHLQNGDSGDEGGSWVDDPRAVNLLGSVDEVVWVDSGHPKKAIFDLYGENLNGQRERLFREYLYSGRASRGLEQQDYLFKFLDAETLRCPERVGSYRYEGCVGRVVWFRGVSAELERGEFQWRRKELLEHMWSVEVPAELVEAYKSAHQGLHEKLDEGFLGALRVVADERWAQSTYELLEARLGELRERVAVLPLALLNERVTLRNMAVNPDGSTCLLDWTAWTLKPVGAGVAPESGEFGLLATAANVAEERPVVQGRGMVNEVLLAALLERVHRLVEGGDPKRALGMVNTMSPLIEQLDTVTPEEVFEGVAGGVGGGVSSVSGETESDGVTAARYGMEEVNENY